MTGTGQTRQTTQAGGDPKSGAPEKKTKQEETKPKAKAKEKTLPKRKAKPSPQKPTEPEPVEESQETAQEQPKPKSVLKRPAAAPADAKTGPGKRKRNVEPVQLDVKDPTGRLSPNCRFTVSLRKVIRSVILLTTGTTVHFVRRPDTTILVQTIVHVGCASEARRSASSQRDSSQSACLGPARVPTLRF